MATQSQAADELASYLKGEDNGQGQSLVVPEGAFKGWLPRILYTYKLDILHLPFLRLISFPVGGTALGNLISIKTFHAVGNYLERLPTAFMTCTCLVHLDLSFNYFREIPVPIFSLTKLEELNFAHNDMEELSSSIGYLANLRVLNLAGNTLSSMPMEIAKCRRIQKLDLSGKFYPRGQLRDFPDGICFLFELTDLDLSWQQIGMIPDEFGNLKRLQILNLKGNHLQHVSPQISKCSRLQSVNLAGALRLRSEIPEALFSLEDLQVLNLSDNFFTEIPDKVCDVRRLTTLVMQRNALLRLPDNLFQLRHLDLLELAENYLEQLPSAVGNLKRLSYLGLDHNRLKSLPDELCKVTSLKTLALGSNHLTSLPENIYHLSGLKELMLENNQLTELPLLMDRLEGLRETQQLWLHGNALRTPPQEICDQGVTPLFHFLKEVRVSEARHRRKMILIGAVKAGKTSLRNALMLGRSQLTEEHERTWVLERHLWEPESRLRVQVLDFGGHHIYQAAHHMFLTPEALHLLVFDVSRYTPQLFHELISNWLDAIMDRAPGATILLVGTHADLCTEDEVAERCEDAIRRMQKEETAKKRELKDEIKRTRILLEQPEMAESGAAHGRFKDIGYERLQEKLSYLEKMLNTRSQIPDKVLVVSCAEGLFGISDLNSVVLESLKSAEDRKLPDSWYRFLSELQSRTERILSMQQALDMFVPVMDSFNQSLMGMAGSADRSLQMVLKYLHSTGEIVWFHENERLNTIVFHRPETLIEMLRAVFRHDFEKVVTFDSELGQIAGLNTKRFELLKNDFIHKGTMTYELLHFTLLQFQLAPDTLDTFISLMLKFDLCYEMNDEKDPTLVGSTRILQFPWFFPRENPAILATAWPEELPHNMFELCFEAQFPRKGPPYFFEKLSVRLQQYVTNRTNWKQGVLANLNKSTLLVVKERHDVDDTTIIRASARGATDLQELWWLLKQTRQEMIQLLQDWPFIQPTFSLVCSHCLLKRYDEPYLYPGEVMQMPMPRQTYIARWCRNHPDEDVPVCFVYPLDKDYQDDIQNHMQAATDFLQSSTDSVDGPCGLLSDAGLAFVATRLGFEWTLLALQLGVRQEQVEQLQMSNVNVYLQIVGFLRHWRDNPIGGAGDAGGDKIRQLLTTLKTDGIEKFDLVEELCTRFHVELAD